MTSPEKIEANRNNAKKSTGPKTEQGKARSAKNATTHGLTAQPEQSDGGDSGGWPTGLSAWMERANRSRNETAGVEVKAWGGGPSPATQRFASGTERFTLEGERRAEAFARGEPSPAMQRMTAGTQRMTSEGEGQGGGRAEEAGGGVPTPATQTSRVDLPGRAENPTRAVCRDGEILRNEANSARPAATAPRVGPAMPRLEAVVFLTLEHTEKPHGRTNQAKQVSSK